MTAKREITRADIMSMEDFAAVRKQRRAEISAIKRNRRLAIGPDATIYFENYDTMWWQIHEMLHIEKGGEAQISDELAAFNPLIPKGRELVATLMFEIDDPARRNDLLSKLGGIEKCVAISVGSETIAAVAEDDVERSTDEGRASSVQFLHFPFTPEQIAEFRDPAKRAVVAIDHPCYGHMAVIAAAVREALAGDFE
jgi:hypothetical protein